MKVTEVHNSHSSLGKMQEEFKKQKGSHLGVKLCFKKITLAVGRTHWEDRVTGHPRFPAH